MVMLNKILKVNCRFVTGDELQSPAEGVWCATGPAQPYFSRTVHKVMHWHWNTLGPKCAIKILTTMEYWNSLHSRGKNGSFVCETGTFRKHLLAVAYFPSSRESWVLGFPLTVPWKKQDGCSQNHWPCWTNMGTRSQCGCKTSVAFLLSTATIPVSLHIPSIVGSSCSGHVKTGSQRPSKKHLLFN